MPSLVVVSGPGEGMYCPLGKRTVVIGRDEGTSLQILDEEVSRKHLQIRFDERTKRYVAFDMRSANGVHINGAQIAGETTLEDGDAITIGKSKLHFTNADYSDGPSALEAYRQRGERGKSTLIR
jgi:pSer/pThr/pTyr-binding forkhead associated (FHA) protein